MDLVNSIVKAVRMGRRIYDNLRKAMGFIVAVHIPIAGIALLPLLTGMPLLLGPIHIAFIEMIIDPVCSLVFEAETDERNVMRRPPRRSGTPLFSRWLVGWSVVQGSAVMAVAGGITLYLWSSGMAPDQLRSAAFLSLVLGITSLIMINRRFSASMVSALRKPNPTLATVLGLVAIILAATQFIPAVADLFTFGRVTAAQVTGIALASAASFILLERLKPVWAKRLLA